MAPFVRRRKRNERRVAAKRDHGASKPESVNVASAVLKSGLATSLAFSSMSGILPSVCRNGGSGSYRATASPRPVGTNAAKQEAEMLSFRDPHLVPSSGPMNVIVWDLETVPDLVGYAAVNGLSTSTDAEVLEAIGDKFPKHIYHSIVCIGALVAHRGQGGWVVDALGAPHIGERTEKQLISGFADKIGELSPQLVTFNGNSFDLPVLRYRAMINEVSAPGLSARPYFNRYTEDALDLCDVLSSFGSQGKASLNELSRILGLPGKPDNIDGGEVHRYFREGKIKEIADYCETDIVNTYRVWLRYELFRGRLSQSEYEASERGLDEFIKAKGDIKPHLSGMARAIFN